MSLITDVDILDEAKECFLTYSSEVLTDRAIPAVEDGLLSAQRKIIWTMEDYLKMNSKSKTKKCHSIVGLTLSTSYFHGDAACYGVLRKIAQPFLMRYPLVVGQGSIGTQQSNDMFASSRYTEAKPEIYADLMMEGFSKGVVPTKETYNGEFMEPVVLPSFFPNAICNGRQAIGVSMSHNSLPHNLTEVCDAIVAYINGNINNVDELLKYIKGPDFPLGNVVINIKDVKEAFATGKSEVSLIVRGDYTIDGNKIIFNTIPYRTYRDKIKEQILANVDEFDKYIEDFNDESSLGENRLVFVVKPGVPTNTALYHILNLTDLQTSLSYNMNYIVDGTPKMCSMIDLLKYYVEHQTDILIKEAKFDKAKSDDKIHSLEGILIILSDIDKAIDLIKNSTNREDAINKLKINFSIDEEQAKAVLELKLARLTKLDVADINKELAEQRKISNRCEKIINEDSYRKKVLINKVLKMKETYGDARRTTLKDEAPLEDNVSIAPEDVVVSCNADGMLSAIPAKDIKVQKKGGKGAKLKDEIIASVKTNTIDILMIFTNTGKVYTLEVNKIPKDLKIDSKILLKFESEENILAITSVNSNSDNKYVCFASEAGIFKKTSLEEYTNLLRNGSIAVKIRENDKIVSVFFSNDEDELLAVSKKGMILRVDSKSFNASGRNTYGSTIMRFKENDGLLNVIPIKDETNLLALFSVSGYGKLISINDILTKSRGGYGIKSGGEDIAGATLVNKKDKVLIICEKNMLCIEPAHIRVCTRSAKGQKVSKNLIKKIIKLNE